MLGNLLTILERHAMPRKSVVRVSKDLHLRHISCVQDPHYPGGVGFHIASEAKTSQTKSGESEMREFLLAAIAALMFGVGSASEYATQANWLSNHQPAWDHPRAAQQGDYNN